jgi:hypothetical protein
MNRYLSLLFVVLIFFFCACLTDSPISSSSTIDPDVYDSLLVIDISEFNNGFYCDLYIRNENLVIDDFLFEIRKSKINLNKYVVIQAKSGNTYYIDNTIFYDYNAFFPDLTKQINISMKKDSTVNAKKMNIYYVGKLSAKKENAKVICSFKKDEEKYDEVLKALIDKYKNDTWVNRAKELLTNKTIEGVML